MPPTTTITNSESDIQKKRFAEMHDGNHRTEKRKAKQTKYHDILNSSIGKDRHKERYYQNPNKAQQCDGMQMVSKISHNVTQYHTISHNITQYHTILN